MTLLMPLVVFGIGSEAGVVEEEGRGRGRGAGFGGNQRGGGGGVRILNSFGESGRDLNHE